MIETERLVLRAWEARDRAPFRAMGRDPAVMRHLGPLRSDEESDATIERLQAQQAEHGHCFWAVERRGDGAFLGFCGLIRNGIEGTPIDGEIEIGWRLRSDAWGQGYAQEGAEASLAWGWRDLPDARIAAITVEANTASWGLMERLGMTRVEDGDFDHPGVPDESPLKRHILYRIGRPA